MDRQFREQYARFRNGMAPGQMIPVRAENGVVLVARETDPAIAEIGRRATVLMVPGTIKYGHVRVFCLLLRLSETNRKTYEAMFDLMRPECLEDAAAIGKQKKQTIILVGDRTWTQASVDMPHLAIEVSAHIKNTLSYEQRWSSEEFMEGIHAMRSTTSDPAALWDILESEGHAVEIGARPRGRGVDRLGAYR